MNVKSKVPAPQAAGHFADCRGDALRCRLALWGRVPIGHEQVVSRRNHGPFIPRRKRRGILGQFGKSKQLIALMGLALVTCGQVGIGTATAQSAVQVTVPVPDYRIQPDDVLDISVVGEPDLTRSVTVSPDGKITYPYVGGLVVTGLTVKEVQQRILAKVATQIVQPEVSVSLSKRRDQTASVLGSVKTPGKIVLQKDWHLLDLLAETGGVTTVRPEWAAATLVRGSTATPVDMVRLITLADPKDNVLVAPGDILIVREIDQARTQVQVLGEVVRPGTVPVPSDGSVAAVLASVGGPTQQAALTRATILRGSQTIPVNLQSLLNEGKAVAGSALQAGDTLVLPTNKQLFAVFGAVTKPGSVPYPEDKKLDILSALALAGGQMTNADLKNVVLVRPSPSGGKPQITELNLWKAMSKGDLSQNVPMQPGDILFLPDKGGDRHLQIGNFIGVVPSLLYLAH